MRSLLCSFDTCFVRRNVLKKEKQKKKTTKIISKTQNGKVKLGEVAELDANVNYIKKEANKQYENYFKVGLLPPKKIALFASLKSLEK